MLFFAVLLIIIKIMESRHDCIGQCCVFRLSDVVHFIIFWLYAVAGKLLVIYMDDGIKRWLLEHEVKDISSDSSDDASQMDFDASDARSRQVTVDFDFLLTVDQ